MEKNYFKICFTTYLREFTVRKEHKFLNMSILKLVNFFLY